VSEADDRRREGGRGREGHHSSKQHTWGLDDDTLIGPGGIGVTPLVGDSGVLAHGCCVCVMVQGGA